MSAHLFGYQESNNSPYMEVLLKNESSTPWKTQTDVLHYFLTNRDCRIAALKFAEARKRTPDIGYIYHHPLLDSPIILFCNNDDDFRNALKRRLTSPLVIP